jgi:hypothetical protein
MYITMPDGRTAMLTGSDSVVLAEFARAFAGIPDAGFTDEADFIKFLGGLVKYDEHGLPTGEKWGTAQRVIALLQGAQEGAQTDLSRQLRIAAQQFGVRGSTALFTTQVIAAADEIERYYGGMLAWKKTAEKKDRDWNAERMARVNDQEQKAAVLRNELAIIIGCADGRSAQEKAAAVIAWINKHTQRAAQPKDRAMTTTTKQEAIRVLRAERDQLHAEVESLRAALVAKNDAETIAVINELHTKLAKERAELDVVRALRATSADSEKGGADGQKGGGGDE